jgi:hypothetical protein
MRTAGFTLSLKQRVLICFVELAKLCQRLDFAKGMVDVCDTSNRRAATRLTLLVNLPGDRSCMRLDEDDAMLFSITEVSLESSSVPDLVLKRKDKGFERLLLLPIVV